MVQKNAEGMIRKVARNRRMGGLQQMSTHSTVPFCHSILLKKIKIKTEKSLGGQMDGVGKKMSEQAPGYFSFHFTQWQYVKNREKRRKGNIEIWGRERMCERNSIKRGSILNSSVQKQLQHFHGFSPLFFNPFCKAVLSEEPGWGQNNANASQCCATQGLTPENLLAMRHGDQPQLWCNSTDITKAVLWQKLFPWEEVLYFKMKRIQKQNGKQNPVNDSIHEDGKFC